MKKRIAAVIVLYKTEAHDSITYKTLLRAEKQVASDELDLLIMLHDNTPDAASPAEFPGNVRYFSDSKNNGLAGAYNRAWLSAQAEGYEWLLTLDQDTELPVNTFRILLKAITGAEQQPQIAAIVPQIRAGDRIVSPTYFAGGAWPRRFAPGFAGVPAQTVYAFNSGALLKVSALRQLGGYSPWFWLDSSDLSLFRELKRFGKYVYIAGDLELKHDFSMLNMQERVSPERYGTMLLAESAFWDLHMSWWAGLERTAKLLGRLGKHILRRDSKELFRLTLKQLFERLFHSRQYRTAAWRKITAERLGDAVSRSLAPERPMVSVCMAAYNGSGYIEAQLRSILPQLAPTDELVIVDDASSDTTPEILVRMQEAAASNSNDPKIVLVRHRTSLGVVPTLEEAVRSATGDILFLADDDDLWASDKVQKVVAVFAAEAKTQMLATGLDFRDGGSRPIVESTFLQHRGSTANLAANLRGKQVQGSAMAFRASLLQSVLPFSTDRLFLHDVWIGARKMLTGRGDGIH